MNRHGCVCNNTFETLPGAAKRLPRPLTARHLVAETMSARLARAGHQSAQTDPSPPAMAL